MVLGAGRAAAEVGGERGHRGRGVAAEELAVDADVELLEALLAGGLGLGGSEKAVDGGHDAVASKSWPAAVSSARSFRRASCRVLYRAPRVLLRRSARTSIGTPWIVSATRTSR